LRRAPPSALFPYTTLFRSVREKLLCAECELHISKYENYVANVFNGRQAIDASGAGGLIVVKGLDYAKFKLFGLSVLWRAGISTRSEEHTSELQSRENLVCR